MVGKPNKSVVIIVAHPDDEILWVGGTILNNPQWNYFVISLCRKNDEDRSFKFKKVLKSLNIQGTMGNLDDGPEQVPLDSFEVEQHILDLVPQKHFDLIITHSPKGEYTKHIRHEEVSNAVIKLWNEGKITAKELWTFAYEDGNKKHLPRAIEKASHFEKLKKDIWIKKYRIITETYGFDKNSWEAKTTPKNEAFWIFNNPNDALQFLKK